MTPGVWQTIDTAPKDGTPFFVWADGYEWPETVRWYEYDTESAAETGEAGYFHYADDAFHDQFDWDVAAGYWMPLPAPPSPSQPRTSALGVGA